MKGSDFEEIKELKLSSAFLDKSSSNSWKLGSKR
jgi:hypothetical protein